MLIDLRRFKPCAIDRTWPVPCEQAHCPELMFEIWERVTYAGINGRDVRPMTPTITTVFASGHTHTELLAYAACR